MANYTKINFAELGGKCDGSDNQPLLQSLINSNPNKKIIIGAAVTDVFTIFRPVFLISNTCLEINGTLKLSDGYIGLLTQDAHIGDKKIYVANASSYFCVGQYVSVSSDIAPTVGSGKVARKGGECDIITAVDSESLTLNNPLINNIQLIPVTDFLISDNAKVGHTQGVIVADTIDNIVITGAGIIDGNYPTQYDVHPNIIDPTDINYRYESCYGGNGIFALHINNFVVKGIKIQETNLAGLLLGYSSLFTIHNFETYHTFMKCFAMGSNIYGDCWNLNLHDSYNEDGLSLHDTVTYSKFKNVTILNTQRIGLLVGAGSNYNEFSDITITDGGSVSISSNAGSTSPACHDNIFTNITTTRGYSVLSLSKCYNFIFNNLVINGCDRVGACLTIGGDAHDITFNGGGIYDTKDVYQAYAGARFVPKLSYHAAEVAGIVFNDFEFKRLRTALANTSPCADGSIVFNTCTISDNTSNGDVDDIAYVFNECIIE